MRLIITGVARTCTLPLPTRGAVCSSVTRSSARPLWPGRTRELRSICASYDSRVPPHVVILGCGFGGLFAARALAGAPVRVTVLDRTNHHLFQPLLYQVATAGLSAPAIAAPIRAILSAQDNVT